MAWHTVCMSACTVFALLRRVSLMSVVDHQDSRSGLMGSNSVSETQLGLSDLPQMSRTDTDALFILNC